MSVAKTLHANGLIQGINWAQYVGRDGCQGVDGRMGRDNNNTQVMTITVADADLAGAVAQLTGYSTFNKFSGNIDRTLPANHPLFPWLLCSEVSAMRPVRWLSKGVGYNARFSTYDVWLLTCRFSQPPWFATLSDAQMDGTYGVDPITKLRQEWYRCTSYDERPASDQLTRDDATQFVYAEGGPGGPAAGTTKFKGVLSQPLSKMDYVIKIYDLPYWGVYSETTRRPENLFAGLNCLNATSFLNFPAGTLLFKGWEAVKHGAAVSPTTLGLSAIFGEMPLLVDLTIFVQFFDPPAGTAANVTPGPNYNQGATTRGWNLFPYPGTGAASNRWWAVSTDPNSAAGPGLLPSYEFRNFWVMVK